MRTRHQGADTRGHSGGTLGGPTAGVGVWAGSQVPVQARPPGYERGLLSTSLLSHLCCYLLDRDTTNVCQKCSSCKPRKHQRVYRYKEQ